jgi:dTDP-4-amino-4,6-dideoxy-D-galactose acyltransferase
MGGTAIQDAKPIIAPLDWECKHFGFFVAQLADADIDDETLASALGLAREQGVRLLVWATTAERHVPSGILDRFDGTLVDRKATFRRPLESTVFSDEPHSPIELPVVPYTSAIASASLIELAISAGAYSRFRTDHHIPNAKFEAMYRLWIERSVAKELADVVLVAPLVEHAVTRNVPLLGGFITLSESNGTGHIGLIAVAAECRGRGIGSALMRAANRWMLDRGADQAEVVTQLANAPACRLYERSGYRLSRQQNFYHFWL